MPGIRLVFSLFVQAAICAPAAAQLVELISPFPNLAFSVPVGLHNPEDGSELLFVVEKGGRVKVFENDPGTTIVSTFIDITNRVATSGEQGLLGLAFDPDYSANGVFYLNYSVSAPRRQRVSRFVALTPTQADPNSEVIIFEGDPALDGFTNHNAGALVFGPPEGPAGRRYLYVTMGDGGAGNDPSNHAQNLGTLLGSIVRLDVDGGGLALDCADAGVATVPPDNPFADGPGGDCDEIFAFGFRNPWRMTLDAATDQIWIGDVGQSDWEEVDLLQRGGNFGWRPYEGNHCIIGPCIPDDKVFPVWEYGHKNGHCSVTGGYVYRGAAIPELQGWYVYGDWCTGSIWAFDPADPEGTNQLVEDINPASLTSFGLDRMGELYVVAVAGQLRKFVRVPPTGSEAFPKPSPSMDLRGSNPFRDLTTLRVQNPPAGSVVIAVYDVLGRERLRLFEGEIRSASGHDVLIDASDLSAGTYVVRLVAGGLVVSRTLTVVR